MIVRKTSVIITHLHPLEEFKFVHTYWLKRELKQQTRQRQGKRHFKIREFRTCKTGCLKISVSFRQANFWLFVLFQKLTIPNSVSTVLSCLLKRSPMYVFYLTLLELITFFLQSNVIGNHNRRKKSTELKITLCKVKRTRLAREKSMGGWACGLWLWTNHWESSEFKNVIHAAFFDTK